MWSSVGFGSLLLILAAFMLVRHVIVWRETRKRELGERERDHFLRQYRRRMQASGMMAAVGIAVIAGIWVTNTVAAAIFWTGVVLVVCWMALLAVADMITTRHYYETLHKEQAEEHAILKAELKRLQSRDGNGRPTDGV